MRLLMQPRTIEPGRFPFNQLDLFLCDFKWLCEFTVLLEWGEKREHSLLGFLFCGSVYAGLIRNFMVCWPCSSSTAV